ncbi:MAG: hypothetical protein WCK53_08525 [Methanomicrobiales archaeon]
MPSALKVLYVDKEKDLFDIDKLLLEGSGDFFVTTIDSALAALAFLNKENFDAIIPGFPIPGMDDIRFLVEAVKKFGQIPFILSTGKRARSGIMVSTRMLWISERNSTRG